MKQLLTVMVILMALTSQAHGENIDNYLSDTQEMVNQGKYKEALERYIWFHDHSLEHCPAMYGVRLSFALGYWKELGDVYPPAKQALIETRDRKTHQLEKGDGNFSLFHDVVALNQTLQEGNKTIQLFEHLDKENPKLAKQCWDAAKDEVIFAKRYDLVRKYIGNPVREFTRVKDLYDHNTTLYNNPQIGDAEFKAYNENNFVEESLRLIDVSIALGDMVAAKEIQKKALAVVDDYRLSDAIRTEKKTDAQQKARPDGE
jgi:hypothetical protein